MDTLARIDAIEALIQQDIGRNVASLFVASRGGLRHAATALAACPAPRIGILTGFYVPQGSPPAAETDGPAGAALLARALSRAGLACRMLTDAPCHDACAAAVTAAGADVPVDSVALDAPLAPAIEAWRAAGIDWVLAIERCGRSADGVPRNMRGQDISGHAAPLDALFTAGPWHSIAIGDGGNELGMGALPAGLIARTVAHGEAIACVTPADHLVVAGVSHWGAYALLAALALLRADWRTAMVDSLDPALDAAVLRTMVQAGPAVDGVTLQQTLTIDSLDLATHHGKLRAIRTLLDSAGLCADLATPGVSQPS